MESYLPVLIGVQLVSLLRSILPSPYGHKILWSVISILIIWLDKRWSNTRLYSIVVESLVLRQSVTTGQQLLVIVLINSLTYLLVINRLMVTVSVYLLVINFPWIGGKLVSSPVWSYDLMIRLFPSWYPPMVLEECTLLRKCVLQGACMNPPQNWACLHRFSGTHLFLLSVTSEKHCDRFTDVLQSYILC
jgi:hypothetical protein